MYVEDINTYIIFCSVIKIYFKSFQINTKTIQLPTGYKISIPDQSCQQLKEMEGMKYVKTKNDKNNLIDGATVGLEMRI